MLYSRLTTPLLLAATCLLMRAGFSKAQLSRERVITCDDLDNVQRLSCDRGVIIVQAALYGRADHETCSEGRPPPEFFNTKCSQEGTLDILKKSCDGKTVCEINTNLVRVSDPCNGIYKYLDTTYVCFPAIHSVTCDQSVANLQCAKGQIKVLSANYGRRDSTTCSYGRPNFQVQNVHCSSPTNKVAESCDGRSSCVIRVSSSVFGDPCDGIYKYLEVAYRCEVTVRSVTCEHSVANLHCDEGQVMSVLSANYGRHDRTTCSEGRPASQIQNVHCSNPTNKVAESCNGKSSCAISASNSVFGVHCHGTYKYLEVTYKCEYAAV